MESKDKNEIGAAEDQSEFHDEHDSGQFTQPMDRETELLTFKEYFSQFIIHHIGVGNLA